MSDESTPRQYDNSKALLAEAEQFLVGGVNTTFTNQRAIHDYRDWARSADTARISRFVSEMAHQGVRMTTRGAWFNSAAHTIEDVQDTIRAAESAMRRL
jgi:glutamate-1-semialdehyde aminotransferase